MKRNLGKITHKMLRSQLKELESDGLIHREEYPQVPPKVEYSLTDLGYSLMPVMDALCRWGMNIFRMVGIIELSTSYQMQG